MIPTLGLYRPHRLFPLVFHVAHFKYKMVSKSFSSAVETGQMSAVETGQVSAVETGFDRNAKSEFEVK